MGAKVKNKLHHYVQLKISKNVIYSFKNRVSFIQEHKSNISDETNLKSYVIACIEPYSAEHGSLELILAQFL